MRADLNKNLLALINIKYESILEIAYSCVCQKRLNEIIPTLSIAADSVTREPTHLYTFFFGSIFLFSFFIFFISTLVVVCCRLVPVFFSIRLWNVHVCDMIVCVCWFLNVAATTKNSLFHSWIFLKIICRAFQPVVIVGRLFIWRACEKKRKC